MHVRSVASVRAWASVRAQPGAHAVEARVLPLIPLGGRRTYVRDPNAAEAEATTVRHHRAARERVQRLHGNGQLKEPPKRPESTWERAWRSWKSTPIRWSPLPVAVGALVLVGVQAHRTYKQEHAIVNNAQPLRVTGPWSVHVFAALPLNAISRAWGWANNLTLPVWFRPYGFRLYAWVFGCNLEEMAEPDLRKYENLAQFFSRPLKPGARPIEDAPLVSPADGKVLHQGIISEGRHVEQVKGITYSLDSLLGLGTPAHTVDEARYDATQGSIADEEHFARVNGIEYSLDALLGHHVRKTSVREYLGGWAKGAWRWTKHLVVGSKGQQSAPAIGTPNGEGPPSDLSEDDAGIATPDTPANLGRYASIAYDVGSEAMPPVGSMSSHAAPKPGHRLFFSVVYLAPGDYHRFHSPTSWIVELRRHFRGELYSVSPYMAARLPNLFLLNERVALLGRWRHGFFGMVPIGATNVGSIRIDFDRELRTNQRAHRSLTGTFSEANYHAASRILGGQPLAAGDQMGGFLLGSTIVLVFEAPESFTFDMQPGEKVRVGQALGRVP